MNLDRAIEDYLAYLHVERGLAAATIRAYRSDLHDFARSVGDDDRWARSADPAIRYLAAKTRRGQSGERSLAPTSLRRRAAALKGFYRFAFGEGIIDVDVATHLDLPRQSRRLPDTLDVAEVDRLLEAASVGELATGPCSSCSTRRVSASARRSGSISRISRSTARSCESSARATRNASCRSAKSRSTT